MSTDMETRAEEVAGRRVVIVANTSFFVGPPLARELAAGGCSLVLGDPRPGLVEELAELGAETRVVDGGERLGRPKRRPAPPGHGNGRVRSGRCSGVLQRTGRDRVLPRKQTGTA